MYGKNETEMVLETRIDTSTTKGLWLYLSIEFLIGGAISILLSFIGIFKSYLPKPPRNLHGDVVCVAGAASSKIGESLAEELVKNGCFVICLDSNSIELEKLILKLRSNDQICENKIDSTNILGYCCNLQDRREIGKTVKTISNEIDKIDLLISCVVEIPQENSFDSVNNILMRHYWTIMGFLGSPMLRENSRIVGITSAGNNYLASKSATISLMENLALEVDYQKDLRFTFLTHDTNESKTNPTQIAKDFVQSIKRDQFHLSSGWTGKFVYRLSCTIYNAIAKLTD